MLLPLPDNACALCGRLGATLAAHGAPGGSGCTGRCVRGGLEPRDYALESALLLVLGQRPAGARLSLPEALGDQVAFEVPADAVRARNAARRLAARGQLELLQQGRRVEGGLETGAAIEVRLPRT